MSKESSKEIGVAKRSQEKQKKTTSRFFFVLSSLISNMGNVSLWVDASLPRIGFGMVNYQK
jgi:hypothetical protein